MQYILQFLFFIFSYFHNSNRKAKPRQLIGSSKREKNLCYAWYRFNPLCFLIPFCFHIVTNPCQSVELAAVYFAIWASYVLAAGIVFRTVLCCLGGFGNSFRVSEYRGLIDEITRRQLTDNLCSRSVPYGLETRSGRRRVTRQRLRPCCYSFLLCFIL